MKRSQLLLAAMALMLGGVGNAKADMTISVNATSAPWVFVNGGLNTNFQWHESSGQPPAVLTPNASAGIHLTPGDILTINYVSGTWINGPGGSPFDAGGAPTIVITSPANAHDSGGIFPGFYFPSMDFPYNAYNLDGVFTNSVGSIIGNPFPIGDFRTVIVPQGATQLQMGMDDTYYGDNSGSVTMSVMESVPIIVPEPASLTLLGLGSLCLLGYHRSWRK